MQIDYVNTPKQSESWLMVGLTTLAAGLALIAIFALMLVASPVQAGQYDGTSWASASSGTIKVIPYDADKCEVCRAENGSSVMTECGPPSAMQPNVPYAIFCGGPWGAAGSAPGTTMVGPGGSVGSFQADSDDYWTVKQ